MYATYHLNSNELDHDFIEAVKKLFNGKQIEITVHESVDETEYLLKTEANKKRLLEATENIRQNKNLIEVDLEELE